MQSTTEAALDDLRQQLLHQVRELQRSRSLKRLSPTERRRQHGLSITDELALKQYVHHRLLLYGQRDDAAVLKCML